MTVCRDQNQKPEDLMSGVYLKSAYQNIYKEAFEMKPIRVTDLVTTKACTAPPIPPHT